MGDLLKKANSLFQRLPISLQATVDEDEDSGLEPEELPDGYDRLRHGISFPDSKKMEK